LFKAKLSKVPGVCSCKVALGVVSKFIILTYALFQPRGIIK
jgi:hypothetical protein